MKSTSGIFYDRSKGVDKIFVSVCSQFDQALADEIKIALSERDVPWVAFMSSSLEQRLAVELKANDNALLIQVGFGDCPLISQKLSAVKEIFPGLGIVVVLRERESELPLYRSEKIISSIVVEDVSAVVRIQNGLIANSIGIHWIPAGISVDGVIPSLKSSKIIIDFPAHAGGAPAVEFSVIREILLNYTKLNVALPNHFQKHFYSSWELASFKPRVSWFSELTPEAARDALAIILDGRKNLNISAALRASAVGVPVITSSCKASLMAFGTVEIECILDEWSANKIFDALHSLLEDGHFRARLRKRIWSKFKDQYSRQRLRDQYASLVKALIRESWSEI